MKKLIFPAASAAAILFFALSCKPETGNNISPAIPSDKVIESKVEKTLNGMTLEEKAGQMVQITIDVLTGGGKEIKPQALDEVIGKYKIGSILNVPGSSALSRKEMASIVTAIQDKSMKVMGIPCIYGLDQIHGASYLEEGTFFPQEINLGATFNPSYAEAMGTAIAYETRAAMVPWVFSPVMDLERNSAWSRDWESWGEDPYLQSVMASTETRALQGTDPNHIDGNHVSVSIKHYMGYGATASGKDRTPAYVPENTLREKFFAPFKASIEAGALNVMVNSASINDIPVHSSSKLITGWLKEGLNWDGMVLTDWGDIDNLYRRDHIAADKKDALRIGINAGIDMVMDPYDPSAASQIVALVKEGSIPQSRVDDAVRRILRMKYRLGLFDNPTWDVSKYDRFGCAQFVSASRSAASESEVLLKNEGGILPLKKGVKILVTGPNSNSIRSLNGGWSYSWQGSAKPELTDRFNTISEALAGKFGTDKVKFIQGVQYVEGGSWQADSTVNIAAAVSAARSCDVIVACIGENSYCETPGNIEDITISSRQMDLVKALAHTGKPIVLILNEGRPRVIREIEPLAKAVVDIMLPGVYGADALADLLSGDDNFSGKLPFTYPKFTNSLHTYDFKVSENLASTPSGYDYDASLDVQWPFGAGLSYTSFRYSNLKVSKSSFKSGDKLICTFDIQNVGPVAGKETALLYSSDLVASILPDVRRLRAFKKEAVAPGERKSVTLTVPADDLAFVGADGKWILEAGDFRISVGGLSTTVKCTETKVWDTQNKD